MSNLFYRLPRLTFLAIGFILISGVSAILNLPRQEDPTMAERYGSVETHLPGASATRVESLVSEKLENGLREIPEIKNISSISRIGNSLIGVELYEFVGKDSIDLVWSEVRDKLGEIQPTLATGATESLLEVSGPVAATIGIAITSESAPNSILERIASELRSRLAVLPGTKETEVYGEPQQEIVIHADPYRLGRADVSITKLIDLVGSSDTKLSAGQLSTAESRLVVEVKGELSSVERINTIPLAKLKGGGFIKLSDVARVTKAYIDPPQSLAIINGQRGIVVTTTMETGRRVDEWSRSAKVIIDRYHEELPGSVDFHLIIDQNKYTEDRLGSLVLNLIAAMCLVLFSLFFLMGIRSALIVGAALPLSIAMVLTGLYVMNIPLHQMSVIGLIIALGLLIDNAIVIVEEYRLQRLQRRPISEAVSGSVKHLFVPLLASTATTAFAFMPIATNPGGVGDFTGTMAVSVILSITSSFFLAMTVIPSIAGFLDRRYPIQLDTDKSPWWVSGYTPTRLSIWYRASINLVMRKPILGLLISLVLPLTGFLLFGGLTKTFFPPVDRNQFQVQISLSASKSIGETLEAVTRAREIINGYPEVESSHWFLGEGAPRVYYNMLGNNDGVASFANGFVTTRDVDDPRVILPKLQKELMKALPNARVMALPFEQGPPFSAPIEIRIVGPDLDALREIGTELRLILSEGEEIIYTTSTLSASVPQISVYPNENMARMLGFTNRDIPMQLNSQLNGEIAGFVMEGSTEIPVRIRYDNAIRQDINRLASSPIVASNGTQIYSGVPLEQLAEIFLEPSPNRIERYQGERINTVSGFLLPYTIPSVAVDAFRARLEHRKLVLPKGYRVEFGGEEEERGEAVGSIVSTFSMYLWLMTAVIVLSLNSFRYAGIIGLTGFLSIGLAIFGVWLSGYPMGYMALIGTLGLIGLAINGAIIVLSALKSNQIALTGDITEGTNVVVNATRHIVSTTITTIGGFLPLILFGGHFWPPLAMAIAGGVSGSAILALYLVPAMFSYFVQGDLRRRLIQGGTETGKPDLVSKLVDTN